MLAVCTNDVLNIQTCILYLRYCILKQHGRVALIQSKLEVDQNCLVFETAKVKICAWRKMKVNVNVDRCVAQLTTSNTHRNENSK